jgi:hypothetical protein
MKKLLYFLLMVVVVLGLKSLLRSDLIFNSNIHPVL